jgi:RNA polymerase sigma-70 factor (sigma-E family)
MSDSFADYVTARGSGLLRFAFVLCGDRHLAEDLVQDVLAKIHRSWARVETAQSPDAYVRRSIVHEFLSWRRRLTNREVVVADLTGGARSVPDGAAESAERDEMWQLLATLPRSQRVALTLRFYEDLEYDEIAEVMGCAVPTARVHAARGLARLRIELESAPQRIRTGIASQGGSA